MLFVYRGIRKVYTVIYLLFTRYLTVYLFKLNNINLGEGFVSNGMPILLVHKNAKVNIGINFKMNNFITSNPIGRNWKCFIIVRNNASLCIGNNVGISGTSIVCHKFIQIDDNVKIGGNVCIYDTDFHSLSSGDRINRIKDKNNTIVKSVHIEKNVFIGAHSTILKGVKIGENSIIGACSVVTKNIPKNEIWAGNPAKFIKKSI